MCTAVVLMHAQRVAHTVSTRAALTDIFEFKYLADYDTLIFDVPACTKERKTFTCVGCVFNFTFFFTEFAVSVSAV